MPCCDSRARLVAVCSREQPAAFDKRQVAINVDDTLTMKLQFDDAALTVHSRAVNKQSKAYETFMQTYQKLSSGELCEALTMPTSQIKEYIPRCVPCIGCRTSIDSFIKSLVECHHLALDPLTVDEKGCFTVRKCFSSTPENLYTLFYTYGSKLHSFIDSIPKSKKSRRCNIHLLEKSRSINNWEVVWDAMNKECREELTLVENDSLVNTMENYLHKHKFCSECKLKVSEALELLISNCEHTHRDRPGFCPNLYAGLSSCAGDKHIHVDANKSFVGSLIARAEPDIDGSQRERHAKTLDVAQEEVLTCIGIHLFERFEKIYRAMRSEEQTWQLLILIAIDCLRQNFETAVSRKQDYGATLESLCEEFRVADEVKLQKKQQKRAKKKARRQTKASEEKETASTEEPAAEPVKSTYVRGRTNSCCSCLHYYRNERSNSCSTLPTATRSLALAKSPSCPSLLQYSSECMTHRVLKEHKLPLSSSLETLFSSVSTRDCVCHGTSSGKATVLCDECPTSSSTSCIRCSSTRTDLGYSSGQDDASSTSPCECLSTACDSCLMQCPLHEVDETCCDSVSSDDGCRKACCVHDRIIDCTKPIELCGTSRTRTLKVQLCQQYPFFDMDLKEVWDDTTPMPGETCSYISDADVRDFHMRHGHAEKRRALLRASLKRNFHRWCEQAGARV